MGGGGGGSSALDSDSASLARQAKPDLSSPIQPLEALELQGFPLPRLHPPNTGEVLSPILNWIKQG